jgi:hypothetical protein
VEFRSARSWPALAGRSDGIAGIPAAPPIGMTNVEQAQAVCSVRSPGRSTATRT